MTISALAALPDGSTYRVTPETIRQRVNAAHRVLELAQALETAETVRSIVAIALADAASDEQNLATLVPEYRRALAELAQAKTAYAQAEDDLTNARAHIRLSA